MTSVHHAGNQQISKDSNPAPENRPL